MNELQVAKNGAGIGYMQCQLNELFGDDHRKLVIDGLMGTETWVAFCKLMDLDLPIPDGINHFGGIEIFQQMYMEGYRTKNGTHFLFVDDKWGRETKVTFDMVCERYRKGKGLNKMLKAMKACHVQPGAKEVPDHYPETVGEPVTRGWRLMLATPYETRERYDSLLDLAVGENGNTIEGFATVNRYCMFYMDYINNIPMGVIVFHKGKENGIETVNVEHTVIPSPTNHFEAYDWSVSTLLNQCRKWAVEVIDWHGVEMKGHTFNVEHLSSSLKAYGFVSRSPVYTFMFNK